MLLIDTHMTRSVLKLSSKVPRCLLCGGCSHHQLSERVQGGEHRRTLICKTCGLIFMVQPDGMEFRNETFHGPNPPTRSRVRKSLRRGAVIAKWIESSRGELDSVTWLDQDSRVLDVGSGTGGELEVFRQLYGCEVRGVEPDTTFARFASEQMGIPTDALPFQEVEFEECFDLVIMSHSLFCFPRPDEVLGRIRRLLTEEGLLYVSVGNYLRPKRWEGLGNYLLKDYKLFCFTKVSLERLLALTGFTAIQIDDKSSPGDLQVLARRSSHSGSDLESVGESWVKLALFFFVYDVLSFVKRVVRRTTRFTSSILPRQRG